MPVKCVANTDWNRCLSKGYPCPGRIHTDSSTRGGQCQGPPDRSWAPRDAAAQVTGEVSIMPQLLLVPECLCSLGHQECPTSFHLYTCPSEGPVLVPRRHTLCSLSTTAPGQGASAAQEVQPGKDGASTVSTAVEVCSLVRFL